MRALFLCLVVAVAVPASLGASGNKLYATFSAPGKDPQRKESFFELPRKVTKGDGWTLDENRLSSEGVAVYCRNKDYRLCLLFDKKNSIAGIQISVSVADFKKSNNAPVLKPLVRKTVTGVPVYSTSIYFVDQSVLKAGGRDLNANSKTAPNGFYLPSAKGLRRMPLKESEVAQTAKFTRQGCIPNMGRHYFNVRKDMKCDDLEVFFGLYNEQTKDLVGGGVTIFTDNSPPSGRNWFEAPPRAIIKVIAPDSPDCSAALALKHGLTTLHFYVTEQPWTLKC